jgi:hypothetical protein
MTVQQHTAAIDTTPVDRATAATFERAEAWAWADIYAAAPAAFAAAAGVGYEEVDGALVLRWAATGRRYFSRAVGLGVQQPATPDAIDRIIAGYERAGISMFLLAAQPHCEPAGYTGWLRERGLEPFDAHDRVVRGAAPAPPARDGADTGGRRFTVERVTSDTAAEWSAFLQRVYQLDTGDWLPHLIERPGWHQYVAREDGELVAARCMAISPDGLAWLGMDGPVPGVHHDDYAPDAALCEHIVRDGLARGARGFVTDIEAPSEAMDTPAYRYFGELGFSRPYTRTHYARVS